jgi:hypothetical protein
MKRLFLFAVFCAWLASISCLAQDLHSRVLEMKKSYASSGNIVVLDDNTVLIEPNMPGPICGLPKLEAGKTAWSFYTFPLASVTVPLALVDEGMIAEDLVFTSQDAQTAYKPGDVGDTTMVILVGMPGKEFHAVMYDRDKLARLGPGPHNASAYGQTPDEVEAFGLTFSDRAAAQAFVSALKDAVHLAKAQALDSRPATGDLRASAAHGRP